MWREMNPVPARLRRAVLPGLGCCAAGIWARISSAARVTTTLPQASKSAGSTADQPSLVLSSAFMDRPFDSLYSHGFARVAAAVPHLRPAEPALQRRAHARARRPGLRGARGARRLPRARAVGLRDRRSLPSARADRRRARRAGADRRGEQGPAAGAGRRRAAVGRGRRLQLRDRDPPRARARRRPQELPARVPRVLRGAPVPRRARGDRRASSSCWGRRCRSAATSSSRASDLPGFALHVEICEDLWVPIPPSTFGALAGATVLINLSASNITVGKADFRRTLCMAQSARTIAGYIYTAAGAGESTTDLAWDGQALICENGDLVTEAQRFAEDEQLLLADLDLDRIVSDRASTNSYGDSIADHKRAPRGLPARDLRARRGRPSATRCSARSSASRTCPPTRPAAASAARRSTTSRSTASRRACARPASRRS